jgi:DNA helicase II / ATP-dependent DNA helicase PcrA
LKVLQSEGVVVLSSCFGPFERQFRLLISLNFSSKSLVGIREQGSDTEETPHLGGLQAVSEEPDGVHWSAGLEGASLQIATSDSRFLRVCAGPGTGKTFSMMRRVARFLDEGVDPERIFVVTFTRAAARDLARALRQLGVPGADCVRASTLHSYCLSALMEEAVLEATGRVPRILMEFEERFLYSDLRRPGRGIREIKRLIAAFGASWARFQNEDPGWPRDEGDRAFHRELISWLTFHEGMLVGELATEMLGYVRSNPYAWQRGEFTHVLVDEYQDLNRANQLLIDLLAENAMLTVVGDEDQSIYSTLQHAQPEGIRQFPTTHAGTEDVPLLDCRRCPVRVVEMATALISHNPNREAELVRPYAVNPPGDVQILQFPTMEDEAVGIANRVAAYLRTTEIDPGEILILTPRRKAAYLLRTALMNAGVPVHSYFFEEALDTEIAQERFTLLNLLVNPDDAIAVRAWLGFRHSDLATIPYAKLREQSTALGISPIEALRQVSAGQIAFEGVGRLAQRLDILDQELAVLQPLYGEGLVDALFPEGSPELLELRLIALLVLSEVSVAIPAAELLDELRTRTQFPEPPPLGGYVRLMSLHRSKRLTAHMVIVPGCVDGWIPSLDERATGAAGELDLEEQRRLFYVALTRTRESLILSSFASMPMREALALRVRGRVRRDGRFQVQASRFLREFGSSAPEAKVG